MPSLQHERCCLLLLLRSLPRCRTRCQSRPRLCCCSLRRCQHGPKDERPISTGSWIRKAACLQKTSRAKPVWLGGCGPPCRATSPSGCSPCTNAAPRQAQAPACLLHLQYSSAALLHALAAFPQTHTQTLCPTAQPCAAHCARLRRPALNTHFPHRDLLLLGRGKGRQLRKPGIDAARLDQPAPDAFRHQNLLTCRGQLSKSLAVRHGRASGPGQGCPAGGAGVAVRWGRWGGSACGAPLVAGTAQGQTCQLGPAHPRPCGLGAPCRRHQWPPSSSAQSPSPPRSRRAGPSLRAARWQERRAGQATLAAQQRCQRQRVPRPGPLQPAPAPVWQELRQLSQLRLGPAPAAAPGQLMVAL